LRKAQYAAPFFTTTHFRIAEIEMALALAGVAWAHEVMSPSRLRARHPFPMFRG